MYEQCSYVVNRASPLPPTLAPVEFGLRQGLRGLEPVSCSPWSQSLERAKVFRLVVLDLINIPVGKVVVSNVNSIVS